jgi:four helix bundle suffix protein
LRKELVAQKCVTSDDVAQWVVQVKKGLYGHNGRYDEISANAVLVLIGVACSLLDRQIASLASNFANEGGFSERLYRVRSQTRRNQL